MSRIREKVGDVADCGSGPQHQWVPHKPERIIMREFLSGELAGDLGDD